LKPACCDLIGELVLTYLSAPLPESFYRRMESEAQELNMRPLLDIVAIVCIGLLIGTELAVSVFINPSLRRLGAREELRAIRLFAAKLGSAMPTWYVASLLLLFAEAIVRHGKTGYALLIAANAIWVVVIVLTILFLVPINNRLARADLDAAPELALVEHGRWDAMHRWRVATLTAAMICFLIAVIQVG
jgi:uncharacterized membrane protein